MSKFKISGEFITLHRLLKAARWIQSGGEAKTVIQLGEVVVNGEVETRRGRKLRTGDTVEWNSNQITVE